jgi:hypothetical protein
MEYAFMNLIAVHLVVANQCVLCWWKDKTSKLGLGRFPSKSAALVSSNSLPRNLTPMIYTFYMQIELHLTSRALAFWSTNSGASRTTASYGTYHGDCAQRMESFLTTAVAQASSLFRCGSTLLVGSSALTFIETLHH